VSSSAGQPTVAFNLPNIVGGTYSVEIAGSNGSAKATVTGQISLISGMTGTLLANGVGANYATTKPGQVGYFNFAGTAGQSLGLALTNLVMTPNTTGPLFLFVVGPDGTGYPQEVYCYTADPGCQLSLFNLPQTGNYSFAVDPGFQATMTYTLTLSQDVGGTLVANTPLTVSIPAVGQNGLVKFTASAGQTVSLTVDSIVTIPANLGVTVSVYDPAGNLNASTTGQPSLPMSLPSLVAGTYSVVIAPAYGTTGSVRVTFQ
jgi:hypothetical protein